MSEVTWSMVKMQIFIHGKTTVALYNQMMMEQTFNSRLHNRKVSKRKRYDHDHDFFFLVSFFLI